MERRAVRGRPFIRRPWRCGWRQAICAQEDVEHDSHAGELVGLAVVQQALVAGLGGGLVAGSGQSGHVEQAARRASTASAAWSSGAPLAGRVRWSTCAVC